jgi:DNA-binding LytR/AlgR family response regulator
MLRCIALDDEPLALELLEYYCAQVPNIQLECCFSRSSDALVYMAQTPIDLIFLDIHMPDVNGMAFYRALEQDCQVVFTTAFSNYAVEGFELKATDYLLKPFTLERFKQACDKALEYHNYLQKQSEQPAYLFVRADYALVKIPFSDICYIETLDDYVKIFCPGKKPIITLMSMKKLLEKLPISNFVRVHRSYIVALDKIEAVRGKIIHLNQVEIPLGNSYKDSFYQAYQV